MLEAMRSGRMHHAWLNTCPWPPAIGSSERLSIRFVSKIMVWTLARGVRPSPLRGTGLPHLANTAREISARRFGNACMAVRSLSGRGYVVSYLP